MSLKMKSIVALIVLGFIAGKSVGQDFGEDMFNPISDLMKNSMEMTRTVQENVKYFEEAVRNEAAITSGEGMNNVAVGSNGIVIKSSGNTYAINQWLQHNILYHTVVITNVETGTTNKWNYTLDLSDANSSPIMVYPIRKN